MEETEDRPIEKLNGLYIDIIKENITNLNLSHSTINKINCEHVKFPPNLIELNISCNKLNDVFETIINLKSLRKLDISFNNIEYFDKTPSFCHIIEELNISNNSLLGPPAWIWFDSPKKLRKLDISCNKDLTNCFQHGYFEELIQFKTSITDIKIYNCKLQNFMQLLETFPKAKFIQLGGIELSYIAANSITDFPCDSLFKCYNIERLNLSYIHMFSVKPNIDIFKNLIEINLSQNELSSLPNEFCNLESLEVCIMSYNQILYLPEDFRKLKNLVTLCLDSNELCMLPEDICCLPNLKKLDLYDNYLCDVPLNLDRLLETDLAQNYVEEPVDEEYIRKKAKLRQNTVERYDSRKYSNVKSESIYTSEVSDIEWNDLDNDNCSDKGNPVNANRPPSSIEDWDSDEYWVPHNFHNVTPYQSRWLYFVKQKMEEGNFCPMDVHTVSVAEKVKYEKLCHPQVQYESDGQFDDYSDDDS